ncbi:hypothetical protein DL98DRAFT_572143 [Cadophora sp. DSE1049]|nr:hypothetical protein DL98DRAFT_572143 [Cadophora sp. DSE1049]
MAGYTKLANFMTQAHHPIMRKYRNLAVRDLLYLQAELCQLEYRYEEITKHNSSEDDDGQDCERDWISSNSSFGEQRAIASAIREKLREYYAAVSQYSEIASIRQPKETERSILEQWIARPSLGGGCEFLGRDLGGFPDQPSMYNEKYSKDLAILSDSHGEDDLFTKFITGPLVTIYHYIRSPSRSPLPIHGESPALGGNRSRLHHYEDRHVGTVITVLGTILSSLAPLISIIVLFFVTNPNARLGLVCVFTVFFSSCLAIATKARRVEVFAATAAFASVQVVFIGTSPSSN